MNPDIQKLDELLAELRPYKATLVAVSKTKPAQAIDMLYQHGHRDFGENYVQEMVSKQAILPAEINWHYIGHLQSNKVKLIAPFVNLIHGIDSVRLVAEVSKQAVRLQRNIDLLLQVHIATEESKFGLTLEEAQKAGELLLNDPLPGVNIRGLMGMASFSNDEMLVRKEFQSLKRTFDAIVDNTARNDRNRFDILSMGMSSDYKIALSEGSTMVRIGSAIFGVRN